MESAFTFNNSELGKTSRHYQKDNEHAYFFKEKALLIIIKSEEAGSATNS